MTSDRAYAYFNLHLFNGSIVLPLKLCTSYPGEDSLRSNILTRTGVNGRPTNRIFVLAREGVEKIKEPKDIEKVLNWGEWQTYLNVGTATKPELVDLSKYEGLKEILEQDKERSKERDITTSGIYSLASLKPKNYNGRNFHIYPEDAKCKNSEKWHSIYRMLAGYLKSRSSFMLITFFSKGEELGALYEDDGVLRIAGLHAANDLKPVMPMPKFQISKDTQKLVYDKFDLLVSDEDPDLELEWRDHVISVLENKGLGKKKDPVRKKVINKERVENDLKEMFEKL